MKYVSHQVISRLGLVIVSLVLVLGLQACGISGKMIRTDQNSPVDRNPGTSEITDKRLAEARGSLDIAIEFIKKGQTENARNHFLFMTRKYPQLSGPWVNLGLIELQKDQIENAKNYLSQAIKVNSKNKVAHNYLGLVYRKAGQFDKAIAEYKSAISIDSSYSPAYRNLGIVYDLYLQRPEKALSYYKKFAELSNDKAVDVWLVDVKSQLPPRKVAQGGGK